jgi:hypothetical protein
MRMLCENPSDAVTRRLWEGIDMCLAILRPVIFRKIFRTLTAVASDATASGADAPIAARAAAQRLPRLPAGPPPARAWADTTCLNSDTRIAAFDRMARFPQDATACHSEGVKLWPPQFLLHLATFRDSFCKYLHVLPARAPSQMAVPSHSL